MQRSAPAFLVRVRFLFLLSLLAISLAEAASADTIENLVFTGTATCLPTPSGICSAGTTGAVTGSYTFDVTTQQVIGDWSFNTPFANLSSSMTGAATSLQLRNEPNGLDDELFFEIVTPTFFESLNLDFPDPSPTELGAVYSQTQPSAGSGMCLNLAPTVCAPLAVSISGSNTIAPEPGTLGLLGSGLAAIAIRRKRSQFAAEYTRS